jgi:Resolvase, N terminal domain
METLYLRPARPRSIPIKPTRRPEHNEIAATSKTSPAKNRVRGKKREADPTSAWGRPKTKMIFTVLGAAAELKRSLIVERVKAGIRNARAKGKKLGRPRADVPESEVEGLRASGASSRAIAKEMGVGVGTAHRMGQRRSKNVCGAFPGFAHSRRAVGDDVQAD